MAIVLPQTVGAPATTNTNHYGFNEVLKLIDKKIESQPIVFPLNPRMLTKLKEWFRSRPTSFQTNIESKVREAESKGFNFIGEFNKILNTVINIEADVIASTVKPSTSNGVSDNTLMFDHINYSGKIITEINKWSMPTVDTTDAFIKSKFAPLISALKGKYNIQGADREIDAAAREVLLMKQAVIQAIAPYVPGTPFMNKDSVVTTMVTKLRDKLSSQSIISILNSEMVDRVQVIFDNANKESDIISELDLKPYVYDSGVIRTTTDLLKQFSDHVFKGLLTNIHDFVSSPAIMSFGKASETHKESLDKASMIYTFSIPVMIGGKDTGRHITKDITVEKYNLIHDFKKIINNKELIHLGKYFVLPEDVLGPNKNSINLDELIKALKDGIKELKPGFDLPNNPDTSSWKARYWNQNIDRLQWFADRLTEFKGKYKTAQMNVKLKYSLDPTRPDGSFEFGGSVTTVERQHFVERVIEFYDFELTDSKLPGTTMSVTPDTPFIHRTYSWLSNILKKMETILYIQKHQKRKENMVVLDSMLSSGTITVQQIKQILSPKLLEQFNKILSHTTQPTINIEFVKNAEGTVADFKISFIDNNGWIAGDYGNSDPYNPRLFFSAVIAHEKTWLDFVAKGLTSLNPHALSGADKVINSKPLFDLVSKQANMPPEMMEALFRVNGQSFASQFEAMKWIASTRGITITPGGSKIEPVKPFMAHTADFPQGLNIPSKYLQKYTLTDKAGISKDVWVTLMIVLNSEFVVKYTNDLTKAHDEAILKINQYISDPAKNAELTKEINDYYKYAINEMKKPYISLPKAEQLLNHFNHELIDKGIPTNPTLVKLKKLIDKYKPSDGASLLAAAAGEPEEKLKKLLKMFQGNPEGLFKMLRDLRDSDIPLDELMNASKAISDTIKYALIGVASALGLGALAIWATGISSARTNKRLAKNNKKYKYKSTKGLVMTSAVLGLVSLAGSIGLMLYVFVIKGGL